MFPVLAGPKRSHSQTMKKTLRRRWGLPLEPPSSLSLGVLFYKRILATIGRVHDLRGTTKPWETQAFHSPQEDQLSLAWFSYVTACTAVPLLNSSNVLSPNTSFLTWNDPQALEQLYGFFPLSSSWGPMCLLREWKVLTVQWLRGTTMPTCACLV
jgi:hypothetical protein